MREDPGPRAPAATGALTSRQQQTQQQAKGYVANRNEKLHLLARQKRTSASDYALMDKTAASAGRTGSAAACGLPSSSTPGKPRVVKLTSVLRQAPQHFDKVKVAAVERMLTDIDELPEPYKSAEVVYLSKNCLSNLQGLQQFVRLRVLSAADNLLPDISCLEVLASCPNLQVATFERNPLTGIPNYRQKVLQLLPSLENLDGQVVTPQERSRVSHALQQEAACMAVMLSNACMVHKLARSAELLQLHTELRRTMFGTSSLARMTRGVLPSYIPLDLLKFLKLWDYEGSLSAEERRVICEALTREVVRVHKQLQQAAATLKGPAQLPALQAWDTAFAKVMLAQQRTIIQLVELVNVLHGEAAALVSKLTGQHAVTPADLQQMQQQQQLLEAQTEEGCDRQLTADQQLAQDREELIIDLRDAALELAGLIAAGETASDAAQRCSASLADGTEVCPSPRHVLQQHRNLQQQQQSQGGAIPAGTGSRSKQLQGPQGAKQGSSLSLRRRSSASTHNSLRLRQSPKPDRSQQAAAAARMAAARSTASKMSRSSGSCAAGSGSPSGAGDGGNLHVNSRPQPQQLQVPSEQCSQGGRYDGLLCSQSPSPEPSQNFGWNPLMPGSHSPVGSTSSLSSPSRAVGALSPTARRLLQAAQQHQHQQEWDLDTAWRQQQQLDDDAYMASAGHVPLTEQPSEQWRALEEAGSAQHLLAAIKNSPASSSVAKAVPQASPPAATASSPRTSLAGAGTAGSVNTTSAKPRPSLHSRGIGPMSRSPGMVSPASSPESPVREEIGVYRKPLETWGSRMPTRPTSTSSSWQAAHMPLPLQQQLQQAQVEAEVEAQLGAQDSDLGRSNPVESPADAPQAFPVCSPAIRRGSTRGLAADADAAGTSSRFTAASAPSSPYGTAWQAMPGSPAAAQPASVSHSAAAASIGSLIGPCRGAVSRTLRLSHQQVAAAAVAEAQQAAKRGAAAAVAAAARDVIQLGQGMSSAGRAGSLSPASASPRALRKSVSWADRALQEQLQRQGQPPQLQAAAAAEVSPGHSPAVTAGPLFAEDMVPGACSMYSPYVPGMRQQAAALHVYDPPAAKQDGFLSDATAANAAAAAAADRAASAAAAAGAVKQHAASTVANSPVPSASPALSTAADLGGASDAVGAIELSEISGLSNASPSSVRFGGQGTPQHGMNFFNALYSVNGEARSEPSDDMLSGQYSNGLSGVSVDEGPYETRDMSKPRGASAGRVAGPHGGSPGAHGEISFALQDGSPGSSLGESAAWLATQGQRAPRGVAGLLEQLQQAHLQQQQAQQQQQPHAAQPPHRAQQQQEDRQLLWDLLQSDEDNMQMDSPASGPDSSTEARASAAAGAAATGAQQASLGPESLTAAPYAPAGPVNQAATAGASGLQPAQETEKAPAAAAAAAVTDRRNAVAVRGTGAAYCDSSRGSFSSSMDLSPVKRQLFRSVSHSCHSLLQNAAGLSNIAAQLDAAAGAAAGHGDPEVVQAGRQALMAKQQRLELQQRVQQQQGGLSQQLAACSQQQQGRAVAVPPAPVSLRGQRVLVAARKVLSSSAETACSWAASSITPYVNEATAAAEAALTAADAATQLSTSCPPALMMQAHGNLRDSQSLPSTTAETASGSSGAQVAAVAAAAAAAVAEASAAAATAAQKQGVLMGLTPVVPGGLDRAASIPSASDPNGSPRPELAHGAEPVAKALFRARGAAAAGASAQAAPATAAHTRRHHAAESIGSAAPKSLPAQQQARVGSPAASGRLSIGQDNQPQGLVSPRAAAAASAPASPAGSERVAARAAALSLPASPGAAPASILTVSGASSLPASPAPAASTAAATAAAAAAAAAKVLLPSSRGSLGPRSTAALAELQSQLLMMAVEKAALQRQLQHGRSTVEQLQEKADKSQQLEQVVHQMRGDLQQATQLLEQTGGAVHEQAALNQQLQEQLQQLQQQLWTAEAERSRQAAADTLAKISLCRRVLRHYAAAAAAAGEWRRVKQAAQQRGQTLVQRRVISTWRAASQQIKAVVALQQQHNRRRMAAALGAWVQVAWEERLAVVQEAAAAAHWARSTGRRAVALWLFYTQRVRMLGVELPSPSTAPSSARGSPEAPELPVSTPASTGQLGAAAGASGGWAAAGGSSRGAARSLGPSFGLSRRQLERKQSASELGQMPERQPAKFAKSAKMLLSAGLVTLTERLSEALSPTKADRQESGAGAWPDSPTSAGTAAAAGASDGPYQWPLHAGRRSTVMGFEQQQQQQQVCVALRQNASTLVSPLRPSARAVSASVPGSDPACFVSAGNSAAGASSGGGLQPVAEHSAGTWRPAGVRKSGAFGGSASRATAAFAADVGALSVPLALHASFVQASRSQRLRRRWLLVKGFKRWSQLLELVIAQERRTAAASRHAARRLQRRAFVAWAQHVQEQQRLLPNGLSHETHHMLQQHVKHRQLLLQLRVLGAWRADCREAADRRRTARLLARHQQQRIQRLVVTALVDNASQHFVKRCRQQKADRHRVGMLLQKAWFAWKDSIGLSHAAAAWQAQRSQQLLARVVCRWQQLSAAVTAAAAAGAKESRLAHLQRRRELGTLRAAYTTWRMTAVEAAAEVAAQAADAAQDQLHQLQEQVAQDQQRLQQLPALLERQSELQQQLAVMAAEKVDLGHTVERQQLQLQQATAQHQQQVAALQSEHQLGVTVLQEQLQQACTGADETMQQLQRLQQQHQQLLMEQQARRHTLEQQVAQQKQELEQQARQQLQRLDQQQQQWNQQQRQDHKLIEQLANRKAQCQELASQLKRCTEKLNAQTAAVQSVKAELTETQNQLAAARALSRNKSLTLTEKAVSAERGRSQLEQQLAQQELANRQLQKQLSELQKQLSELQKQLDHQRAHGEARKVAAVAEQRADVLMMQQQLGQKDDVIAQLKDSMGAVQAQLASQQAKVVSETNQLRDNWSQAKQIIKQQRKTIKAQELQLQLLGTPPGWSDPGAAHISHQQSSYSLQAPQQQPTAGAAATAAAAATARPLTAETSNAVLKYPITSWVLQSQQQQQQVPQHSAGGAQTHIGVYGSVGGAGSTLAGTALTAGLAQGLGSAAGGQPGLYHLHASAAAGGAAAAVALRQAVGVGPAGVSAVGAEQSQSVLSRTTELLQCTDDILKSLRARTVQC